MDRPENHLEHLEHIIDEYIDDPFPANQQGIVEMLDEI